MNFYKLRLLIIFCLLSNFSFSQIKLSGQYFRCLKEDCRDSEILEFLNGQQFKIVNHSTTIKNIGNWLQLNDTIQLALGNVNPVKKYVLQEIYGIKLLVSGNHLNFDKILSDLKLYIEEDKMIALLKDSSYTHIDKKNRKDAIVRDIVQKRIINFLFRGNQLYDVYVLYIVP